MNLSFRPISDAQLSALRQQCYASLSAPLDGMWDDLIHRAVVKGIFHQQECIGYFCHDQAYTLINFFINDSWLNHKEKIFRSLMQDEYYPQAYVSTNHPCFLTSVLPLGRGTSVYYYLFEDSENITDEPELLPAFEKADFRLAGEEDIKEIVRFCQQSTSADEAWLTKYTEHWVARSGIYYLTTGNEILGTCELRKSDTQPGYADLGAIVSPAYRKLGIGSYLMQKGKFLCYAQGLRPICSCRFDNKNSRKMIENAGFLNRHLMLKVRF